MHRDIWHERFDDRLRLPLIAAPMFLVSGPDLVIEACRSGVVGAFPTANCRTIKELGTWLDRFTDELESFDAPFCPNLIMRRDNLLAEVDVLIAHGVEMVITSVGSPAPVIGPLHDAGCVVFADVASLRHARRAIDAGADGLVLLTAGAGGQTGWANGFSFVRAVRQFFDGPIVLAGGVSDGQALLAAEVLGCDLGYMGTKFIATSESLAAPGYKEMVVNSGLDDILLTDAMTGLETSLLRPSVVAAGVDPDRLAEEANTAGNPRAGYLATETSSVAGPTRWRDIWSAGHSASGVDQILPVAELVDRTVGEYQAAQAH